MTHMRVPNDKLLANKSKEIDLFLGGHDHIYYHERTPNGNLFVKSGSDFKSLSLIKIEFRDPTPEEAKMIPRVPITDKNVENKKEYIYHVRKEATVSITKFDITRDVPIDQVIEDHINDCYRELDAELAHVGLFNSDRLSLGWRHGH